jgi:hypothetical protein
MHLGFKNGPFVPHNLIPVQGSPVPLLKSQMAPSYITEVCMLGRAAANSNIQQTHLQKFEHQTCLPCVLANTAQLHFGN